MIDVSLLTSRLLATVFRPIVIDLGIILLYMAIIMTTYGR